MRAGTERQTHKRSDSQGASSTSRKQHLPRVFWDGYRNALRPRQPLNYTQRYSARSQRSHESRHFWNRKTFHFARLIQTRGEIRRCVKGNLTQTSFRHNLHHTTQQIMRLKWVAPGNNTLINFFIFLGLFCFQHLSSDIIISSPFHLLCLQYLFHFTMHIF